MDLTTGDGDDKQPNALIPLKFEDHEIRIIDRDGAPWWVLSDVCDALNIKNASHAAMRLKHYEKCTIAFNDSGPNPAKIIISESGLYRLIGRSNKPEAERFMDWVYEVVLPSIRKTGSYGVQAPKSEMVQLTEMFISGMKEAIAPLGLRLEDHERHLAHLTTNMVTKGELVGQMNQIKCEIVRDVQEQFSTKALRRKDFPDEIVMAYADVVHRFLNGACRFPGCQTKIVGSDGKFIKRGEVASIDHLHGHNKVKWSDGLPVCMPHNQELEKPGIRTRADVQSRIQGFQELLLCHHSHLLGDKGQGSMF